MGLKKHLQEVKISVKVAGVTRKVLDNRKIENKYEKEE
jgi:hypothetical protein